MRKVIHKTLLKIGEFYDFLFNHWEGSVSQRLQANLLVSVFVLALFVIELARWNVFPDWVGIPKNHFYAVKLAFDLLLMLEVLGLIFNLADSVANSMGKQFEILSLILLRQSFKEFVNFEEPIAWEQIQDSVLYILSDSLGALLIFGLVSVYYAMQRHRKITEDAKELASFVAAKKVLALFLLLAFITIGFFDVWLWATEQKTFKFFEVFYTVLIFSDILIVLISLRYNSTYSIVFRNSGFAVATVIIRLALTAPPFFNVGLGVSALILSIGLTYVYNNFSLFPQHSEVTYMKSKETKSLETE